MSIGVLTELRIKHEYLARFLLATRLYSHRTRCEAGRPCVEIFRCETPLGTFVIRETFCDQAGLEAHASSEHVREWLDTVSTFADGALRSQRVVSVLSEPPALLRKQRPAVLETATVHPPTYAETAPGITRSALNELRRGEPPAPEVAPLSLPRLQINLERIEIANMHDGFLRGDPEPCVVVGCYQLNGSEAESIGRALYRFSLKRPVPCDLSPRQRLLDLPVMSEHFPLSVCVLLFAFEENGGSDIRAAYQDLAAPASFFVWSESQSDPEPVRIGQHAFGLRANHCESVQVLRDGEAPHRGTRDDSWVGAASGVIKFTAQAQEGLLRYHARSHDGRNDWLTELSFRLA